MEDALAVAGIELDDEEHHGAHAMRRLERSSLCDPRSLLCNDDNCQ
jgi:hypothetical protein